MYSFRYRFYPKDMDAEEYFDDPLASFLGALAANGQIVGDWNIARDGKCIEFASFAPDDDSLDNKYYSEYATKCFATLCEYSEKEPNCTLVGEVLGEDWPCACEQPSTYILYTDFIRTAPPVLCGDCGGHVPLYRLPHMRQETDYYSIRSWESTYQACDKLYIGSGVGELFGLKQMRNPKSELTVEGLSICKDVSAKLGKPFYYYLNLVTRMGDERPGKRCPSCGTDWQFAEEPIAGRFHRKCDECGFVAW